jgi:hypothetical protein
MTICKEEDCFYNQNGKCTNIQEPIQEPIGTALNKPMKDVIEFESKNRIDKENNSNA